MRTRAIRNGTVAWFGSLGLDEQGNKLSTENFSTGSQHVVDGLIQRLSVFKGELWYKTTYGLPLFEKIKSKAIIDATVLDIVESQSDVKSIISFESSVVNRQYSCKIKISTIFGDAIISI